MEEARKVVDEFVTYYNYKRLHSAIGYITPKDKLEGHESRIFAERDRKLTEAREKRKQNRTRKVVKEQKCRLAVNSDLTQAA